MPKDPSEQSFLQVRFSPVSSLQCALA
jgi:hypothetical protein